MRLINYGFKIMDHTFILKGGAICVFFGYRLTRRPERVVNFKARWYAGLGWGSLALARQRDGTWGEVSKS